MTTVLTSHAQIPSGQAAWIYSITTSGTHGSVTRLNGTDITYKPGGYYSSLAKGSTAIDRFSYCITDSAGAISCNSVTVTVAGAAGSSTQNPSPPSNPAPPQTGSYSCLRNWYVATNGSDNASGSSASSPWATLSHADQSGQLQAGDCVNIASGTYYVNNTVYLTHGGNANSSTGYIVYRASTRHGARIKAATQGIYNMMNAQGNYIIIDGLEVDGGNEGLSYNPMSAGHCVEGDGHHFQALNNLLHDCGGAGVSLMHKDWYWVQGNTIYNTAYFFTGHASGISIYEPVPVGYNATSADNNATYHVIVQNNVVYNNGEWHVPGAHTDGNGIILDDFQNTQSGYGAYPYKSLIQGNTAYNNGGRGIHVFYTNNATITGNVAYSNNSDTAYTGSWRGELSNALGSNNTWTNNQAATTSVAGDIRAYNTAVLDGHEGTPTVVTWSNNANYDTRTGGRSYQIDTPARASAFPASNPLGKAL
ncbi:MAG TPA: hypothetical protein VKQ29_11850 [Aliidongia sp.]|nr:hypothetical protein [Aliidongia sp.]